jgi:membrane protein CcdC involved in cytochrome C biogenesis
MDAPEEKEGQEKEEGIASILWIFTICLGIPWLIAMFLVMAFCTGSN